MNENAQLKDFNPFATRNQLAERANAGTVLIEQERAIAEVKGKLTVAKMFPRDEAAAFSKVMDACSRRELADAAEYSYKRGSKIVTGPTIRLAEVIAAAWGNIDYGMRELSRGEGYSEMEAYAWDMQTNTISAQRFTVNHIRDRSDDNGGNAKLTSERDIYETTANSATRRMRERIFAVIPADLVTLAVKRCRQTIAGESEMPLADRVRRIIMSFGKQGVTVPMLEAHLSKKLDDVIPDDLPGLNAIYNSLREGAKVSEFFGSGAPGLTAPEAGKQEEEPKGDPAAKQEGKGKRADKTTPRGDEPEKPKADAGKPALTPPAAAKQAGEASAADGGIAVVF